MKSNVCKIQNGTRDLDAILRESERVAEYCALTHTESLRLRLLCEELDGMLPNLIDEFYGDFWIEAEDGVCKINASIEIPEFSSTKKEELIAIAKNKKNAAAVGIVGKIRDAIENILLIGKEAEVYYPASSDFHLATGFSEGIDYSYIWSLEQYRTNVKEAGKEEEWDELEKSVIAAAADDVIVSVRSRRANIAIVKSFK